MTSRSEPNAAPTPSRHDRRRFLRSTLRLGMAGAAWRAGAAHAAEDVIRYGGDASFAPFESLDAQGRPQGFQVDLLQALGQEMGARFEITLQPWNRTEEDFRQGRFDAIALVDTSIRRTWANFAQGHATPALALYHRRERAEPQLPQGIEGLRIATTSGEPMRETLRTWLAGVPATFVPLADAAQALAAVQQQQADIALVPRAYGDPLVASGSLPDVVGSRASLNLQSYAFAVAPGNDALRQRLQAGLDALERSGRLESLRVQWLSSHREVAERLQLERGLADEKSRLRNVAIVSAGALLLMGWGLWQRTRRLSAERSRRHTAEQALQRAEELLERTFTHHPEPLLLVDRTQGRGSGIVRDANAALLSLLGVSAPSLIGRPLADQSSHIDAAALEHLVHSLDSDGVLDAVPLRLTRADGTVRDCLVSAEPLTIGEGLQVFCMLRDITEQLAHDAEMRRGYDALQAELAQLRSQLDAARAAQREAENLSDDLTRSIAQELRAPLHAVEGFVGLLRERLRAGHVDEALAYSAHIERAARRMSAMMAALSSLSQVARQPLRRRPVDMQRLVRDTWSQIAASQPTRQVDSRLMELPAIDADPDLIAQVWKQLLGNAWKFTARVNDAKVLVDSRRDERGTWYRVTDNGVGFDMSQAERLFHPFQRLHASSQFAGIGMGLSLVRRIVEHHGGEVRLRSAPGVGTIAEFTLDPAPPPP